MSRRAEVYAITAPLTVHAADGRAVAEARHQGRRASRVKAPRNPNLTADADDPSDEVEAPEGPGLDQGAPARLEEPLTAEMLTPVEVPDDPKAPASTADGDDAAAAARAVDGRAVAHVCGDCDLDPRPQGTALAARRRPARSTAAAAAGAVDHVRREQCHRHVAAVGTLAPVQAPTDGAATDVLPSTPIEAARPTDRVQRVRHDESGAGREADEDAVAGAAIPGRANRVGRETLLHRAHGRDASAGRRSRATRRRRSARRWSIRSRLPRRKAWPAFPARARSI